MLRPIRGGDFAKAFQEELHRKNRPLARTMRSISRNSWGSLLLEQKFEDMAQEQGFHDVVAAMGEPMDDKSFLERLADFIERMFTDENIERLKEFFKVVMDFIKMIMAMFTAQGNQEAVEFFRKIHDELAEGLNLVDPVAARQ